MPAKASWPKRALVVPYCRRFDFIARTEPARHPDTSATSRVLNDLLASISLSREYFDCVSLGTIFDASYLEHDVLQSLQKTLKDDKDRLVS